MASQLELRVSAGRRAVALGAFAGLTLVLIALGIQPELNFGARLALFLGAALAGWSARSIWRATSGWLVLDADGIRDHDGQLIAAIDQIKSVDRGVFAFKPSGGFLLHLTEKAPFGWAPGLWWRRGRTVGVGGVTHGHAAKAMAEELAMRIAARPKRQDR